MGCRVLLQGVFLSQGWNPCLLRLLYWQADSLTLSHLGSPQETLPPRNVWNETILCPSSSPQKPSAGLTLTLAAL